MQPIYSQIAGRGQALFVKLGFDVKRASNRPFNKLLRKFGINVVLDVGANVGQFGYALRQSGYHGRIVSFEPLKTAFRELARRSHDDPQWVAHNFGLGDYDGEAVINRSVNTQLSSLCVQTPTAGEMFPTAEVEARETIAIRKLDSVFPELANRRIRSC